MLERLDKTDYHLVAQFFPKNNLYCVGILSGKYNGKVLVDSVDGPTGGLLCKDGWCTVAGDPENQDLATAIAAELTQRDLLGEDMQVLYFVDTPPRWIPILSDAVTGRTLIESPRRLFVATPTDFNGKKVLPPRFELAPITQDLVHVVNGELPEAVQKVLALRKQGRDGAAFGFVALEGQTCASWAVVDFIVGSRGEIRFETAFAYRRRGLASFLSSITIDYGLQLGLKEILWNVAASNVGSIRTAEGLGLQERAPLTEHILIYPEVGYYINLAFNHLDAGRYGETLSVASKMLELEPAILMQYGYFLSGAARAGMGQPPEAFAALHSALDQGFDAYDEFAAVSVLDKLKDDPAWIGLATRLASSRDL